jgi:hypothetical protein
MRRVMTASWLRKGRDFVVVSAQGYELGEAGSPVAVVWLPARGWPPEAAARRAGLEDVEKLLTSSIYAANKTGLRM